jgi:hypothetical protein
MRPGSPLRVNVAGRFGVHASTVHSALRKAGVQMRDTQGRER